MLRLTLRNLAANKARFLMTTFAVVLGVGFVVSSFVLSDGLRSTFNQLSEDITVGTDLLLYINLTHLPIWGCAWYNYGRNTRHLF